MLNSVRGYLEFVQIDQNCVVPRDLAFLTQPENLYFYIIICIKVLMEGLLTEMEILKVMILPEGLKNRLYGLLRDKNPGCTPSLHIRA